MKIGPVDIRNHTFTRKMRGVDEHEVRDYLDLVADRLEEVVLEAEELRGRIDQLETEVRDHRALERSLRDSMLSAERLVDDRSAQAEKEAQIVIKNAEVQAGKILLQAREELGRLKGELDDLRRQKVTYVERFRALLRSQGKILEASLESFDPDADSAAVRRDFGSAPAGREPAAPAPPPSPAEPAAAEPARPEPPRPEPPREDPGPRPGTISSYVTRSTAAPPPPAAPLRPEPSPPPAGPGPEAPAGSSAPWQAAGTRSGREGLFGGENA